jgi:MOSC domain-containing protein YiiM
MAGPQDGGMNGIVEAVAKAPRHQLGKRVVSDIQLFAGLGVGGDAHAGVTVKHRSRARVTPDASNLRQVHLIHAELFDELATQGFAVGAGVMGENVATRGIDLLDLPRGTRLKLGDTAVIELTGLRNPCAQLDQHQPGLMKATLEKRADGTLVRKAGVMAIVLHGGNVRNGDPIAVTLPAEPHVRLEPV